MNHFTLSYLDATCSQTTRHFYQDLESDQPSINHLLITHSDLNEDEIKEFIKEENSVKFIFSESTFGNQNINLNSLTFEHAQSMYQKSSQIFQTQFLLDGISNIFKLTNELKEKFKQDYDVFFYSLWDLVQTTLQCRDLKIYYHDVKIAVEENEKNSLITKMIFGESSPTIELGSIVEEKMIKTLCKEESLEFDLISFNQKAEENELAFSFKINSSPILVMAKDLSWNHLTESFLKGLTQGLNQI